MLNTSKTFSGFSVVAIENAKVIQKNPLGLAVKKHPITI